MQQQTFVPDVPEARDHLRQRIEEIISGTALGRFWTPLDLAAALTLIRHIDSRDSFGQLVASLERAVVALNALSAHGAALIGEERASIERT